MLCLFHGVAAYLNCYVKAISRIENILFPCDIHIHSSVLTVETFLYVRPSVHYTPVPGIVLKGLNPALSSR